MPENCIGCTAEKEVDLKGNCLLTDPKAAQKQITDLAMRYKSTCTAKDEGCAIRCCGKCPTQGFGHFGARVH